MRGRYIRGNVDESLSLGTLAANTLIGTIFDDTVNERTLVTSLVATWVMSDFTSVSGDGPILVGIAHSDYTDAEVEQVIETTGSWDEGDLINQEIGSRKVRKVGFFRTDAATTLDFNTLNEGKPIKMKLNWILNQGQSLRLWAYNAGSGALTTGVQVKCNGHANLFPQ